MSQNLTAVLALRALILDGGLSGGERVAHKLRWQMRCERPNRADAIPLIVNFLGGGERVGDQLWRQMGCERFERGDAIPFRANSLGGGERVGQGVGFPLGRQMGCE